MKIYKHLTANAINLIPFDFTRELSMEAYLIENPLVLGLDNDGYEDIDIIEDELKVLDGRKSLATDGRVDLVGYYNALNTLAIIEIKKGSISRDNISQLTDYLKERNEIYSSIQKNNPEIENPQWIGILVGTSISNDLISMIEAGGTLEVDGINVPLAALTIKRYKSDDGQFFIATETYQNIQKNSKDYKQYSFNGSEYGKGRLVLAIVQNYVQNNPSITFADLKNIFPDNIQGSSGIFVTQQIADSKMLLERRDIFQNQKN